MTDKNQKNTQSTEDTQASASNNSCCSSGCMTEMMQKFCGGEKGNFDCSEMMKSCCGSAE